MKTFWNELLCAVLGHPGTWVAEIDDPRVPWRLYNFSSIGSVDKFPGDATLYGRDGSIVIHLPWRCSRCRRTLAEIRDDYSVEPDWLKKLGW